MLAPTSGVDGDGVRSGPCSRGDENGPFPITGPVSTMNSLYLYRYTLRLHGVGAPDRNPLHWCERSGRHHLLKRLRASPPIPRSLL